jgi:ankyrin repeat protein
VQVSIIYDLHAMCLQGELDLIKVRILPRNINQADQLGRTPLMCAVLAGHAEVTGFLISQKADLNLRDRQGWSALMWASYYGKQNLVQELVRAGASTILKNKKGMTALQLAQLKGHKGIAEFLNQKKSFHLTDQMQSWMYYLLSPNRTKNH